MVQKEDLKDLFTFSRGEKNGIWVLTSIILILITINYLNCFRTKSVQIDHSQFQNEINAFLAKQDSILNSSESVYQFTQKHKSSKKKYKKIDYFHFNPNGLSREKWKELGLSEKQINVLKNYESKGGVYKTKGDLKKMYSISDRKYQELESYIDLPVELKKSNKTKNWDNNYTDFEKFDSKFDKYDKVEKVFVILPLNKADTTDLKELKGIGPFYARKIVDYRESLGGFINIEQLLEVSRMRDETYEMIRDHFTIDQNSIIKIRINSASLDELKRHPYLNYKKSNAIFNYRLQHGNYKSIEDLKKLVLLSDVDIEKIAPYLSFDD